MWTFDSASKKKKNIMDLGKFLNGSAMGMIHRGSLYVVPENPWKMCHWMCPLRQCLVPLRGVLRLPQSIKILQKKSIPEQEKGKFSVDSWFLNRWKPWKTTIYHGFPLVFLWFIIVSHGFTMVSLSPGGEGLRWTRLGQGRGAPATIFFMGKLTEFRLGQFQ